MLDNLKKYRIVLASNSPRRKELLAGLGLEFTVRTKSGIDESYPSTLVGDEIPQYISKKKSDAYLPELADDELMITADTIVYCDGQVLGKPKDAADAKRMLRMLSGKTHDVITGVSITTKSLQHIFAVTSKVRFASLSDDEIDDLLVLDIKDQNYFDEGGVENQHGGGGQLFSRDKDIMGWLFSQKK